MNNNENSNNNTNDTNTMSNYVSLANPNYIAWSKLAAIHGPNSMLVKNPADPSVRAWVRRMQWLKSTGKLNMMEIQTLNRQGFDWKFGFVKEDMAEKLTVKIDLPKKPGVVRKPRKPSVNHDKAIAALVAENINRSWIEIRESGDSFAKMCVNLVAAHKRGSLTQAQIETLNSVAFIWNWREVSKNLEFDKRIAQCEEVAKLHGEAYLTRSTAKALGKSELFNWQVNIRTAARRAEIRPDQIEKLIGLGVMVQRGDRGFEKLHAALKESYDTHGHCNLDTSSKHYPALLKARRDYLAGALDASRKAKLDAVAFDPHWTPLAASLEKHMDAAVNYWCDHEGSLEGFGLTGNHQQSLRYHYAQGQLSSDQVRTLEAMGFKWRDRAERRDIYGMVSDLLAFKEKHGHMVVPATDELGNTVNYLRSKFNRGDMPENEVAILTAIGFPFDGREARRNRAA